MNKYEPLRRRSIMSFSGEYRFLSNFWFAEVVFEGDKYPTVEHAYQAAKTVPSFRYSIKNATMPGEAKRRGRSVPLHRDWEDRKLAVMESLVRQKFTKHPKLRMALLKTGDAELVEGNNWNDTYWGVCRGVGYNHLGKILMKIREELRKKL